MDSETPHFTNYDTTNIITPVKVDLLEKMLIESKYDAEETKFLVKGFREGFDICYEGPEQRKDYSDNIPFRSVGSSKELWQKLMKEVNLRRYAGPFQGVPFQFFAQSPIGLVPKAGSGKTRLIFHLSYHFAKSGQQSINAHTMKELCRVKYRDLDEAVRIGIKLLGSDKKKNGQRIYCSKTDLSAAFRLVPLAGNCWKWMVMKARDPDSGEWSFFFDKCLPFGHSISCAIFQRFSNALKHLLEYVTNTKDCVVNYLDDFLFLATSEEECNFLARSFIQLCKELGVPIADEKTEWASTRCVFWAYSLMENYKYFQYPKRKDSEW